MTTHDPASRTTFRVAGIGVHVQLSGLALAGLIGLSLFQRFRDAEGVGGALLFAVLGGVSFVLSILAHEMGHAVEARSRGLEVTGVRLFLLGGVTSMRGPARTPRDEFAIAAVGPFVSLLLAAVLGTVTTVIGKAEVTALARVADVTGMLGWLNLALAIFNSIPGAPLDGGRMLRALLWRLLGDRGRAVRASARVGQLVALGLGLLALQAFRTSTTQFDGIWLVVLAMFMWQAATSEHRTSRRGELLRGRAVASLPTPRPTDTLDVDWTASRALVHVAADAPDHQAHVVARGRDGDWEAVGAVTVGTLRALHPHDREVRRTGDVAVALDDIPVVAETASVADLVDVLQDHPFALTRDLHDAPHLWTLGRVVAALEARVPA